MAISPSGYLTFSPGEKYQRDATVRGPSLPVYITSIESSFAGREREDVIPVESPTVPNALVISKSASESVTEGSRMSSIQVDVTTRKSARRVIIEAFLNASLGMEYRKAFAFLLVAALFIPSRRTKNVVVFIPPLSSRGMLR